VKLFGRRYHDLSFAPCLCEGKSLSLRLERALRVDDDAFACGRFERCELRAAASPHWSHDWDLIVTPAPAPASASLSLNE